MTDGSAPVAGGARSAEGVYSGDQSRGRVRVEFGALAEIAGISGFAVAQPVLAAFGESPETFVAVGASPSQIVWFALAVALLPALLLWAVLIPAGFVGPLVRRWGQVAVIGLLAGAAATTIARGLDLPVGVRLGAAVVAGAGIGFLRFRDWVPVRLFLRYTAPLPVILVFLFLFSSPVAPLVRPPEATTPDTSQIDDSGERPPVVLIVLDELPTSSLLDGNGAIDANRFPNIAKVADTSTWYRNHTSNAANTLHALPILMTGQLPVDAAAGVFPDYHGYPDNLFTLLGDTYEVNAHEEFTRLCPPSICPEGATPQIDERALELTIAPPEPNSDPVGTLLEQAWGMWRSEAWPLSSGFDSGYAVGGEGLAVTERAAANALTALSSIQAPSGEGPVFDYIHFALPHQPWNLLPSGRSHDGPEIPLGNEFLLFWPEGDNGLDLGLAGEMRMQLQLQWTDRVVGDLIDRLEALDRWDDALVVLTADHGYSFEAGTYSRFAHENNQRSLAWSPLFVKLPNQTEPDVLDDTVMAMDVVPTVLEVLEIEAPWNLDGVSLLDDEPPGDRPRPFVLAQDTDFETSPQERLVILEADGLTPLLTAGRTVDPDDELGAWRHGRLGDLLGQEVTELGVCAGEGPALDIEVSSGWRALVDGQLDDADPLPLWHQGLVDADDPFDVVGVVDGRIVAWSATSPMGDDHRLGLLFAEPLVRAPGGNPFYYEVVDGPDCRLRPLAGQTTG